MHKNPYAEPLGTLDPIKGLSETPKKIKARKVAPKLVPGGSKGLVFQLSKASHLSLTLERCKGKRGCAQSKPVRGSAEFDAIGGASAIKFKGSLNGTRKLRRGRYTATLTPTGGEAASTRFKVVKKRRR